MAVKKFPWLSLVLLLVAYSTLGWVISGIRWHSSSCAIPLQLPFLKLECHQLFALALAMAVILLLSEILASPLSNIRKGLIYSISTDTRAFILIISVAFLTSVLVLWIHVAIHALLIVSAGLLARLDMLVAGFKGWQAFGIIAVVSLLGFGLGASAHYLTMPV